MRLYALQRLASLSAPSLNLQKPPIAIDMGLMDLFLLHSMGLFQNVLHGDFLRNVFLLSESGSGHSALGIGGSQAMNALALFDSIQTLRRG